MKALKYILTGAGIILGVRYVRGLIRTGDKAVVEITGKVDKVTAAGIVVVLKYNIKNPARTSIKMTPPLIKIIYQNVNGTSHKTKDSLLASSSMALVDIPEAAKDSQGRIRILPSNETGEITTRILIPFLQLIGLGSGLITQLKDPNQKVNLVIETNATVYTTVGSFPYDERTKIAL